MTQHATSPALDQARAAYDAFRARGLKLNMQRGQPSDADFDLSNGLLTALGEDDVKMDGLDLRNYPGGVTGLRDGAFRSRHAAAATFIVNGGFNMTLGAINEARTALDDKLIGSELRARVHDNTARQVHLSSSVEVLPNASNRVTPDWDRRDALGLPLPKVDFRIDDYTMLGWETARRRDHAILTRMGARDISPPLEGLESDSACPKPHKTQPEVDYAIIGGTAVMGDDPKTSVVDRYGRSHDHANLFILGTSAYPTVTICSPSLTLAAQTLRAADHIVARGLV